MPEDPVRRTFLPDPAAVFAIALSLWQACNKHASEQPLNLSDCYSGMDQFMREVMRIASQFEAWGCVHIEFNELNDVWPYLLEDKFGGTCLQIIEPTGLAEFDDNDCLRVALRLRLPVKIDDNLPIPVDVTACNPVSNAAFREFQIQTVRNLCEGDGVIPFTLDDEPFDEEFGPPYFALYGISDNRVLEHIADRRTYSEAVTLATKLAPGIAFPSGPTFAGSRLHE